MIEHVCRRFFAGDEYRQKAVAQDVLLRLWEHFDEGVDEAWVYRVCVNTAIDHYRRLRPERERLVPIEGIDICNPERPMRDRMYELIDQLDEADQELVFYYLDGLTERRMAALTGLTESYIGVRMHRIKKKLKELNTKL